MHSEQTKLLGLPQWKPQDHPDFLTDINEAFSKIDGQFQTLDGLSAKAVADIAERMTTNEAKMQQLATSVGVISENVAELQNDMELAMEKLVGHENEISSLHEEDTKLDKRIAIEEQARIEQDVSLKREIESNEKRIESLEDTADTMGSSIVELQEKDALIDESFDKLHTEVVNVQGDVNQLREDVETIGDAYTEIIEDLHDIDNDLASIKQTVQIVNTLGDDVDELKSWQGTANNSIEQLVTDTESIKESVRRNYEGLTQTGTTVIELQETVRGLEEKDTDFQNVLGAIQSDQEDITNRMNEIEQSVSNPWEPCVVKVRINLSATLLYPEGEAGRFMQIPESAITVLNYDFKNYEYVLARHYAYTLGGSGEIDVLFNIAIDNNEGNLIIGVGASIVHSYQAMFSSTEIDILSMRRKKVQ